MTASPAPPPPTDPPTGPDPPHRRRTRRRALQAGRSIRELLERFRVAEHKRVTSLHGALRVFVSLQQRLWADISASTTAVNALFKDRLATTALADQPVGLLPLHLPLRTLPRTPLHTPL